VSDLPESWEAASLVELCERLVDGSHNPPPAVESGRPMLSARNINDFRVMFDDYRLISESAFEQENARTQVAPGDVLLTIVGTIGRTAVVAETHPPFALQRSVAVLKPRGIDSRYLAYALNSPERQQWLADNAKGTAQKGVYLKTLGAARIPVAPSAEQVRIVSKLEELLSDLDAGVVELKAAQKKLARYRQSLLKAAVEGTLTADWRAQHTPTETGTQLLERILTERRFRWEAKQLAKFKEQGKSPPKDWQKKYLAPVRPDTTELPQLPEGWVWASLDMLGEIASGVAKGIKRNAGTVVREVPYLRVANVQRGYLDLSEVKTILATERDIEELTLVDGDVLFNEGGDRDKLGRGWVWREEVESCIHQNHVFRMRPYLSELQPELLSHHGNTFGKLWFQNAGKQTTNLASINMTMLRAFPVPVAPAEEQVEVLEQIKAQLDSLDRQEAATNLAMKQAAAQRQNILRAAFAGQLVPQDPADEPASVLLERIRAERAEREKRPKVRKSKQQEEIATVVSKLIDVLAEAGDWVAAQEAFQRCGVADGAETDQVEALYAELRALDKAGRLAVEAVTDTQGRKLHDRLKLLAA
jgi:type I restriction enzyme, S subunit